MYFTLHFPERLFALMLNKELKIRSQAISMLAKFSYTDIKGITEDLMRRGVIRQLEEFVRLFPNCQPSIVKNIILVLNNLIFAAESNVELICTSPICKYVIAQFTSSDKAVTYGLFRKCKQMQPISSILPFNSSNTAPFKPSLPGMISSRFWLSFWWTSSATTSGSPRKCWKD